MSEPLPNSQTIDEIRAPKLQRAQKIESPFRLAVRRFLQHKLAVISVFVLVVIFIMCFGAPLFTSYDPLGMNLPVRNQSPSHEFIFGTDSLGRDILTRTLYAGRVSLMVGIAAAAISVSIGIILGSIAGYFGGIPDMIISRITDIMMTFPPIIIMMTVASFVGPGLINIIFIIGGLRWPSTTRLVRGQFLSLKNFEFVQASHALGLPNWLIIARHILPNTIAPLMANVTFAVSAAILTEAGLSFLGLGVPLPTPTWGNMMENARNLIILQNQPWVWLPSAFFTLATILCINFIGDGLRDALDPQQLFK